MTTINDMKRISILMKQIPLQYDVLLKIYGQACEWFIESASLRTIQDRIIYQLSKHIDIKIVNIAMTPKYYSYRVQAIFNTL